MEAMLSRLDAARDSASLPRTAFMADPISVAAMALPSDADLARAEAFTREPFVHPGEDPRIALAPGTPRRRALDAALAELAEGRKYPSTTWRREFALLLGLERVLSEEEPKLADGTTLSAHQVDALSGTLTALLAEALREGNANGNGKGMAVDVLAGAAILGDEDELSAENGDAVDEPDLDEDDDGDDDEATLEEG